MTTKIPAQVFPPGDRLKEELDARGWTQADLADILGRPARLVSEIITAKRAITPETAHGLGGCRRRGGLGQDHSHLSRHTSFQDRLSSLAIPSTGNHYL